MKAILRLITSGVATALVVSGAFGFSVLGTKWGLGLNVATHLSGHEGTPGVVSWSIMPGGPAIHGFDEGPDTHEGHDGPR